ncbi:hypothetical protein [Ovoidimarina sediminis]|uniref:hypothetical protein n=1 Tax=Ovoidimarina sediminis TaxID=3079856 RepID=UPI0029133C39|nr:hypothetical protein [Rhodophyticola sp. MJ-SS7]MDU8942646.1 hypothetical protein [Rhodophyticola sp. MJ-SS7]
MLSLAAPLFLILLPAIAARDGTPSRILLVSGLAWAIVACVEWALTAVPLSDILPRIAPQGSALHDTYYVVSHVQVALGTALTLLVLGLLTRQLDHGAWRAVAWILQIALVFATHAGAVVSGLVSLPTADTFALALYFERLNTAVTVAAGLSVLMITALILGILLTLISRLRGR